MFKDALGDDDDRYLDIDFTTVLSDAVLPNLRLLSLSWFTTSIPSIRKFLTRHARTLDDLRLDSVRLEGEDGTAFEHLFEVLREVGVTDLKRVSLSGHWSLCVDHSFPIYYVDMEDPYARKLEWTIVSKNGLPIRQASPSVQILEEGLAEPE